MTFEEIIEDVMSDIDESMNDIDVLKKVKRFINRAYKVSWSSVKKNRYLA